MTVCPGCHKPEPTDWCWASDFYCPLDYPPRYLDVRELWREVRRLSERLAKLEPPCPP